MSDGRPITVAEARRIALDAMEMTDRLMREDRERETVTPDPPDAPAVPTAPATLTVADAAARKAEVGRLHMQVSELEKRLAYLLAELVRAQEAIQAVLGNGADEEAWPPGTHYADALGPFVEGLRVRVAELEAENARSRTALARIRDECGQVCPDFMECEHAACASSYGAYILAAEALEAPHEQRRPDP